MMLPGNGCPVNGFLIGVVISEKLPCRISAVGHRGERARQRVRARRLRRRAMKNVLLWPS